jgi:hypothetical protein
MERLSIIAKQGVGLPIHGIVYGILAGAMAVATVMVYRRGGAPTKMDRAVIGLAGSAAGFAMVASSITCGKWKWSRTFAAHVAEARETESQKESPPATSSVTAAQSHAPSAATPPAIIVQMPTHTPSNPFGPPQLQYMPTDMMGAWGGGSPFGMPLPGFGRGHNLTVPAGAFRQMGGGSPTVTEVAAQHAQQPQTQTLRLMPPTSASASGQTEQSDVV